MRLGWNFGRLQMKLLVTSCFDYHEAFAGRLSKSNFHSYTTLLAQITKIHVDYNIANNFLQQF